MPSIEYQGMKFSGGKFFIILSLIGTIIGGGWTGYKFYDEHALRFGFEEQRYGHAICTIINPQATNKTDLMICFSNLEEGAEYLKWKRHKVK